MKKENMNKNLQTTIASDKDISTIWPNVGLAVYRGSISHGTAGDVLDDIDIGGVFISPLTHYFGLSKIDHIERVCLNEKYDFCLYELKKFVRLLLGSNPNVLCFLWAQPNMYLQINDWGKQLIENRQLFISKHLYKTFSGYAYSQLKRMTRPCTDQAFQGKKRKERFEQFGYDCKNASHLIRLFRTGIEALTTGEINVFRHDAEQLKEIKYGQWSLEQVEKEAHRLQNLMDEALVRCTLQATPNFKKAETLLMDILETNFS